MFEPKPLFDNNISTSSRPKKEVVGSFKVPSQTDLASKEVLSSNHLSPKKVVGAFTPPAVNELPQKSYTPKSLFESTRTAEADITPHDRIKYKSFSDFEIAKIKDLSEQIDLTDRIAVLGYGADLNEKLVKAVDDILQFAKQNTFDSEVCINVNRLKHLIDFNLTGENDSLFSIFKKKKTISEKINETISEVEKVSTSLQNNIKFFLDLIPKTDDLLDRSKKYHSQLILTIAAGRDRISVFERRKKLALEDKINGSNVMIAQNARDEMDIFSSFVKRVDTLDMIVTQNELTLAQIRMTQSTNVKMVENLNNMLSSLIPLWKQSLVTAISTNNFDNVQKNKDLLSQSICDIMTVKVAKTV